MQYLLTKEEYDKIIANNTWMDNRTSEIINGLCTRIADSEPILVETWKERGNEPWGCIHSGADEEWYCDHCPVQNICTQSKNWSK